jgi:hypothetical protein
MLAKKGLVNLAILLIAGTALLSTVCFAAEQTPGVEPPKTTKVQGVVKVAKDANDVITKVTLTTKDGVAYNVALNTKGRELGKEMADKEVEVDGVVSKIGDENRIKVQSYKAVEKTPIEKPVEKVPKAE